MYFEASKPVSSMLNGKTVFKIEDMQLRKARKHMNMLCKDVFALSVHMLLYVFFVHIFFS